MKNIILLLLLISCSPTKKDYFYYSGRARKTTSDTAFQIQKTDKNLNIAGQGSSLMDKVSMLAISFQYLEELSIDHARKIIINYIELLKNNINKERELRPYLANYPFTEKNIQASIFISSPKTSPEKFRYASLCLGEIEYCNGNSVLDNVMFSETYEEALTKVQQNKQEL